ncbi:protein KRI1 homolog isoform X1 [Tachypleus tridentatus]|uniref:protein KRI1 homolog isoform X1 n=1 Tax=Tachypleus tridentatus TaxID=6853 RepID=UPI003FD6573C
MSLFANENSSDSDDELKINSNYAARYNNWRQKEEFQKLKDKYGNDVIDSGSSSGSSESEDENAKDLTPTVEKDFLKTLSLLKKKDPRIYNPNENFFQKEDVERGRLNSSINKKEKQKPMYLKDYERKVILEKEGKLSDEDENTGFKRASSPTYYEDQQLIKESFKEVLQDSDADDEVLLQKKRKTKEEKDAEEGDYLLWLKGQCEKTEDKATQKDLVGKFLRKYWNNPSLDNGEVFLRDYILNKKYLDEGMNEKIPSYEDIVDDLENLSEDEKTLEEQASFEQKFNFRFEEPDQEFIKRYPRTLKESLRRKDNRRKQQRDKYKERKEKEKVKKKEELKRLKALKRKEIVDKLDKLRAITGNAKMGFDDVDLDGDFDPVKYDEQMKNLFSDDYYAVEEGDQKPEFPPDEEIDEENWDDWQGYDDQWNDEDGPHCEDVDFNMDVEYEPQKALQEELVGQSKKKKRWSAFQTALRRKKPIFNPTEKTLEEYFDEYYKLDFEDIIGDMPVRFRYRQVVANDFGLSTEEILLAQDKELNKWCSLKKAVQNRPEEEEKYDVQAFQKKSENFGLKQKILASVYSEEAEGEPAPKKKRHKKRKLNNKSPPEDCRVGPAAGNSTVSHLQHKKTCEQGNGVPGGVGKKEQFSSTAGKSNKRRTGDFHKSASSVDTLQLSDGV